MDAWKVYIEKLKKRPYSALGVLLLLVLTLPLVLAMVFRVQDVRTKAALPDQLEAESGVLTTGASKQSDSQASGGQFVRFSRNSSPTSTPRPTSPPNPSIPPNAIYVPDSIDSTGSRDVWQEINSFIENTPNGSTIVFKKDGTYNLGRFFWLRGRRDITLEGNGATLNLIGNDGNGFWDGAMYIDISENITVRNFNIEGNFALAGTPDACCPREGQAGIRVGASKNLLIEYNDITRVGGDCFTISSTYEDTPPNDGVMVRNNRCTLAGRMGTHTINSNNVTFDNNYFDGISYAVFASEPNKSFEGVRNLVIKNNEIGSYGLNNSYEGALYYYSDAWWSDGPSDMSGITITGNTVEGNISGKNGVMLGLDLKIYDNETGLRENVTVTNNVAKKAVDGTRKRFDGVMRFEQVKGLTVSGNTQPLSAGNLISQEACTNVNISSNNTN